MKLLAYSAFLCARPSVAVPEVAMANSVDIMAVFRFRFRGDYAKFGAPVGFGSSHVFIWTHPFPYQDYLGS